MTESEMVKQHDRLVYHIANRYANRSPLSHEDLLAEGRRGLLHAIRGYDPARAATWGCYAYRCIAGYVCRAIKNEAVQHPVGLLVSLDASVVVLDEPGDLTRHDTLPACSLGDIQRRVRLQRALQHMPLGAQRLLLALAHNERGRKGDSTVSRSAISARRKRAVQGFRRVFENVMATEAVLFPRNSRAPARTSAKTA